MIRFVDIRDQGIGSRFAFWDTVTDKWVEIAGDQAWNNWDDVCVKSLTDARILRLHGLCPPWVFDGGEDDVETWYMQDVEYRTELAPPLRYVCLGCGEVQELFDPAKLHHGSDRCTHEWELTEEQPETKERS